MSTPSATPLPEGGLKSPGAGLITLDPGERRRLSMMGPKSEQYARTVLQALVQNQGVVPSNVDVAKLKKDLGLPV